MLKNNGGFRFAAKTPNDDGLYSMVMSDDSSGGRTTRLFKTFRAPMCAASQLDDVSLVGKIKKNGGFCDFSLNIV